MSLITQACGVVYTGYGTAAQQSTFIDGYLSQHFTYSLGARLPYADKVKAKANLRTTAPVADSLTSARMLIHLPGCEAFQKMLARKIISRRRSLARLPSLFHKFEDDVKGCAGSKFGAGGRFCERVESFKTCWRPSAIMTGERADDDQRKGAKMRAASLFMLWTRGTLLVGTSSPAPPR